MRKQRSIFKASVLAGVATALALTAHAQGEAASGAAAAGKSQNLFELLDLVENGLRIEDQRNAQRLREFQNSKERQTQLLAEAEATLRRKEAASRVREDQYSQNETAIAENEARLEEQVGQLGELFGVVRQVATDAGGQMFVSLISSQLGDRKELLDRLGRSKELPTTDDLEKLWFELHREMTEQGQVVRYSAPVLTLKGDVADRQVVRAGPFSAVSEGAYLAWEAEEQKLRELDRQPPAKYLDTVQPFEQAKQGVAVLAVDPSQGTLLEALTYTPDAQERVAQGGYVGMVILTLGILAFLLGVTRWVIVTITSRRVAAQKLSDKADRRNPLGRVLAVFEENQDADPETLELRLDEAILRESTKIKRLMWPVKTVSVVAPLLGLLGTVTGMIQTFQAITLFGAGDPKMMAGGISEALVTTMLGLITAIPLVLLYDMLSNSVRFVIDVLNEQSTGLIASRSERENVGA